MILLLSRLLLRQEQVTWIARETRMEVRQSGSAEKSLAHLGESNCRVVVVDSGILETESKAVDRLLGELPWAVPIFPNLAVCGAERLADEIRFALRRCEKENQRACESARRELRCSFSDSVTAFLLTCDLALQESGLPFALGQKILRLHELASKMRDQLEIEVGRGASA
jgi:hypothetical protein